MMIKPDKSIKMKEKYRRTFILLCAVSILSITFASGQILSIDQIKTEPVTVNTGFSFKLHSTVLNEDRTIMISLPDGYDGNTKKYPVLYMLDGQWGFNPTSQALGWLSYSYAETFPQTIVVGIHTPDKREDNLTPTHNIESNLGGGADRLYQFIKEELIPFIDKNYRTYNYRVLGGGSIAGVFVMHAFMTDPQLFNDYLAFSPSMWWDNGIMLNRTKDFLLKNPNIQNRLFFCVANEGPGMGVDSLAEILKKYSPKELIWKFDKYPEETHATSSYKGIWNGLKFLFTDWNYPLVDFGTEENLFSQHDSIIHGTNTHEIINLPDTILDRYSDFYLDSYGRILTLTKTDRALLFSGYQQPTVTLYPEAENRFFIHDTDVQNKFFLKGFDIQFEFIRDDLLVVTANKKIEYTAKKLKHPPVIKLSDDALDGFVGTYMPNDKTDNFRVTREGNILKLSREVFIANLYPITENRFFAFIEESSAEFEFINDESNNVAKMNIYDSGEQILDAKKIEK